MINLYPNQAKGKQHEHKSHEQEQCAVNGELRSLAIAQDAVAHEFFHGLTSQIIGFYGFVYSEESGALDESYADIFAILVSNFHNTDIGQWKWEIGRGLGKGGSAIRDLSNPRRYNQPEHWNDYRELPMSELPNIYNDWGWVHDNSGIHNKAAYNLLISQNDRGKYLLDATSAAKLFYQALSELSNTSTFSDSRHALEQSAKTFLRKARKISNSVEIGRWENIVGRISEAFDNVGIQ
ncbi:M4 family metallopeptidase [Scytonema sp. NUACC26]|uniref:M4 family metallopeptidase n=1 Tax=Scytonema sp. NUACC26 TaxID=3140176 RepID=UPI0034DC6302